MSCIHAKIGLWGLSSFFTMFGFLPCLISGEVLGEWCDEMVPAMPEYNRVMILKADEENPIKFTMESTFGDGSTLSQEVRRLKKGLYVVWNSPNGESYRIREDGDLELIDFDGIIRKAKKVSEDDDACIER